MHRRLLARISGLLFVSVSFTAPAPAFYLPQTGYRSETIADTSGQFVLFGGLDIAGDKAYLSAGTNIWAVNLTNGAPAAAGTLPPNVSAGFLRFRDGDLHAAYDQSFAFPFPSRHGVIDGLGAFQDRGGLDGIYDAAVNAAQELFIAANPGTLGAKVFRYQPATTSVVEVIHIGGPSGGLAFDEQDRLYVATQTGGGIVRFTPAQLTAGNLSLADGEPVVNLTASYLAFDHNGLLHAVSGFGNRLAQYDVETGRERRVLAVDGLNNFGIGRIHWDAARRQLLAVYSDFFFNFSSDLHLVRFAASTEGIPGTSSVFRGWAAAYRDFTRPDPDSGGFARDASGASTTSPAAAILGRPASFDPDEWPLGNLLALGNGGSITLEFADAIINGPGPDFAVFENAFDYDGLTFAEFAFVEVATTTNAWARFPVTYHPTNLATPFGPAFAMTDVTGVDGLAGKHALPFGTPFDLDWLRHHPNVTNGLVDLNRIAYVRLTDAVGDGSTTDDFGNPILDPFDSFTSMSDGFDLRGVGVIHLAGVLLAMNDGAPVARWHGYEGRTYQPQVFAAGDWSNLGGPLAGTGAMLEINLPANHAMALFRVEQTIPASP
ncbi:MAG TPA: hypothetical protein PKE26_10005 [Kiritimatiellia bacterium]|nr:hypothetical protein [Kiritimatiellia bacterium]HMO99430.1 hypothetical protein [Kiritimatiellia bacterium]HMP97743.1 hypothetical protein [Kiritimatiellia bacterium]